MKLQLLRNATMKIDYAGQTLLTDPMLSAKGTIRSFAGIAPNPTIDLPFSLEEILDGVTMVLVSHLHPDHFDDVAGEKLPKNLPIFCPPHDAERLSTLGFGKVCTVEETGQWGPITLHRTGGKHGSGPILERMGEVSGFVLAAPGEPKVYWVGDSIWCDEVAAAIATHKPNLIITHSGGATIPGFAPILMDAEQTLDILKVAPHAKVVAIHMEALDHCTVSRTALKSSAEVQGISQERLFIPNDGETLVFTLS